MPSHLIISYIVKALKFYNRVNKLKTMVLKMHKIQNDKQLEGKINGSNEPVGKNA